MESNLSLDGRTLAGVSNADAGDVDTETRFEFRQEGDRISATYAGGDVVDGYLVGSIDGSTWDIRYVQLTTSGETATGHSVGEITELEDGRVRVEDEWEWESKPGSGASVLEEVDPDAGARRSH